VTLAGFVMVITAVTLQQDTVTKQDTVPTPPPPVVVPAPAPAPVPPPPPPTPTIEQTRYMEGLKTATRGIAQVRDGLNRVVRTQSSDSLTRAHAAKRLGGLCGSGRSFIVSGRPKMQPAAYADSVRILAKQLTVRLDSLSTAMTACEKTAGRDPTTASSTLTTKLKAYDDALLAFRNAQAALYKPDSTKAQDAK
jgi:hypothetical protein